MEWVYALLIGGLYAMALYMLLRRSLVKLIIGILLLSQATNLLVFVAGGMSRGRPPLLGADTQTLAAPYADPLPQALILTAIVIGFGVLAFALVLVKRAFRIIRSDDFDAFNSTDT